MMHRAKKLKLIELNQHIICKLCKGYFIDATTIIECLHSFCRSCIVKYLETNKYCPVCDVQVHKTKPLLNIRPDRILQDIVYKLVPRLYQNEVQRRREFTTLHPETRENFQQFLDKNQSLLTIDESISITLYYYGCKDRTQRYLRCPAAVTIGHLQKLIRAKYNLTDDNHYVDILYENIEQQDKEKQQQQQKEHCLNSTLTLLDIAYIYKWNRKTPMELCYRIYEYSINCKKQKLDDDKQIISNNKNNDNNKSSDNSDCGNNGNNNNNNNNNNINSNNWKEVQLRISENGEMSITGIQDENLELLNNNNNNKSSINNNTNNNNKKIVTLVETKTSNSNNNNNNNNVNRKELPDLRSITKNDISNSPLSATTATTTTVYSTINSTKCSISEDNHHHHHHHQTILKQPQQRNVKKSSSTTTTTIVNESKSCKRKLDSIANELPTKRPKQTILNHQIGVYNLSNNHPLKRHSLVVDKTGDCENVITTTTTTTGMITTITTTTTPTKIQSKPCYMPKTTVNTPKSSSNNNNNGRIDTKSSINNNCTTILTTTTTTITTPNHSNNNNNNSNIIGTNNNNNKLNIKSKASTPIGYKTLRDPPKSWNSQISKANLLNKPILDNTKYNNNNNNTTNNNNNCNNNNNNNGNDLKNMRPAKFFKMRNNLPRYLGNPASGVKPMYQLHNTSPEKETITTTINNNNNNTSGTTMITTTTNTLSCSGGGGGEIKKHSIVKIDPKTLRPITEKASETTSLVLTTITTTTTSTTTTTTTASATIMSDLKINTSSVSIFNPLKLQNSPKSSNNNNSNSDRKSPKSPQSPKLITSGTTTTETTTTTTSTTVNKRDNKLNLNFTPSNPFIPNLTSPTINPNQFLYPTTGPPHGFPPYDPRFMAAYHSLLYRQRMAFPTSLTLDISKNGGSSNNNNNNEQQQQQKKKNFDSAPSSPKLTLNQQQSIVSQDNQISPTTTANNTSPTTKITTIINEKNSLITTAVTIVTTTTTTRLPSLLSSKTQTNQSLKRGKESTNKSEKSLQSTVEKLKNNRVKEAAGNCAQTTNTTSTTATTTTTISNSKKSERIETKTVDINEKITNKDDGDKNQEIKKLSDKHLDSDKSNDKKDTNGDKCEQEQQQQQEEKQQKCHEDKDNSK